MKRVCIPGSVVAIDEWLAFYKGMNPWRVCIKVKPSGVGFKFYVIADKHHFAYHFILYKGESMKTNDIVLQLVETLPKPAREKQIYDCNGRILDQNTLHTLSIKRISDLFYFVKNIKRSSLLIFKDFAKVDVNKGEWAFCSLPSKLVRVCLMNVMVIACQTIYFACYGLTKKRSLE
eukprot:TRINITY_DN968_c0_g1_i12.p1 TRINITY_DN968_c0_g1~~TRINITY_DN968_c0_g1_i12.p1  ORF type:complete len:176 (-),score=27.61 TRINITY_DN968_c0_g1_i12:491-1018(-)